VGIIVLLLKHFYNSDFFKKRKILRLINFLEVKIDINIRDIKLNNEK